MAGVGPARMGAAAWIIARQAQALAAAWSRQVPPSIRVRAGVDVADISSGVGPSYPNEVIRVRHPVFEDEIRRRTRTPWVTNQYRPFLKPAADMKADAAAAEIARTIDDYCAQLGYH